MNRAQLLEHFDALAETPEAIPKLRRFVLDLATQGQLLGGLYPRGLEKLNLSSVIELLSGQHLRREEYNLEGKGIPYLTGPADFGPRLPYASRWTITAKPTARKGA